MTEFNGYKLKPVDYKFKVGDILIKILDNFVGELAIVTKITEYTTAVENSSRKDWTINTRYWRAIETLPGSQAKAGDTVYCISDTGGSCNQHDSFKVKQVSTDAIYVEPGQKLIRTETATCDGWNWSNEHFVVLVKSEQPKYELDMPGKTYHHWYVSDVSGFYYLRQDLTVQSGVGANTLNSGYWPTEAEALAARAQYLGESVQPKFKVGDIVECISTDLSFKHVYGFHFRVTKVMPNYANGDTHLEVFPEIETAKTPKANRFKLVKSANSEQRSEIKVGSHWERIEQRSWLDNIICIDSISDNIVTWSDFNKTLLITDLLKNFKPRPDLDNQTSNQSENNTNQQTEKQMPNSNLILLIKFLATQAEEKVDATNAKHIGILAESDGSYVGYVYANTIKELQDIVRKPENEGRKLHIFDYNQTIAQKARPVTQVSRV